MAEIQKTVEVTCERVVLMQIIRGDLAPEMALAMGQVDVDDLGQLMAFKMAFKLERPVFNEYLAKVDAQEVRYKFHILRKRSSNPKSAT